MKYKGYFEATTKLSDNQIVVNILGFNYYDPPKLIIIRGCSGSGKSTIADNIKQWIDEYRIGQLRHLDSSCNIHSTDNYFIENGIYKYDPKKLHYYHTLNISAVREDLGFRNTVIVDNTDTVFSEMAPYFKAAIDNDVDFCIIEPIGPNYMDVEVLAKRNVHGVPPESIKRMKARWQTKEQIEFGLKCIKEWEKLR